MDVSTTDAVSALAQAVADLLPPAPDPALSPEVLINPIDTRLSGIGGYVGTRGTPGGEVHARRLSAQAVIRVKAANPAELNSTETAVSNALVGANRAQLRRRGIFRVSRDAGFGQLVTGLDANLPSAMGKDIRFDIDYEFQQLPSAPQGIIEQLPVSLLPRTTDGPLRPLYQADFADDPLADFTALDDAPTSNGPGVWQFNPVVGRVEQTSAIAGGSHAFNSSKRGTCLVLQPARVPAPPANWLLQSEMAADSGGLGLVFNFRDLDSYHYFLMIEPAGFRLLGKKTAGAFQFLDHGGRDNQVGYGPGIHTVQLLQQGREITLTIDQLPALTAREDTPPSQGLVGFLARNSSTARFHSLRWIGL